MEHKPSGDFAVLSYLTLPHSTHFPLLVFFGGCFPHLVSVHVVEVERDNTHYLLLSRDYTMFCVAQILLIQTTKFQEFYLYMYLCIRKDKLFF